jgi:hypothetical protein
MNEDEISATNRAFEQTTGTRVLPPRTRPANLAEELTLAIEEGIDIELFNQKLEAERSDAAKVVAVQERCAAFFLPFRSEALRSNRSPGQ